MESFNALVLSLPTRNSTLRMRVWRGLKETGCGVLRDGVYLLPASAIDGTVLAFTASTSLLTVLFVGVAPALSALRANDDVRLKAAVGEAVARARSGSPILLREFPGQRLERLIRADIAYRFALEETGDSKLAKDVARTIMPKHVVGSSIACETFGRAREFSVDLRPRPCIGADTVAPDRFDSWWPPAGLRQQRRSGGVTSAGYIYGRSRC